MVCFDCAQLPRHASIVKLGLPPLVDLDIALGTTTGWSGDGSVPLVSDVDTYCLVHQDGTFLHFADSSSPMTFMSQITAAVGAIR